MSEGFINETSHVFLVGLEGEDWMNATVRSGVGGYVFEEMYFGSWSWAFILFFNDGHGCIVT